MNFDNKKQIFEYCKNKKDEYHNKFDKDLCLIKDILDDYKKLNKADFKKKYITDRQFDSNYWCYILLSSQEHFNQVDRDIFVDYIFSIFDINQYIDDEQIIYGIMQSQNCYYAKVWLLINIDNGFRPNEYFIKYLNINIDIYILILDEQSNKTKKRPLWLNKKSIKNILTTYYLEFRFYYMKQMCNCAKKLDRTKCELFIELLEDYFNLYIINEKYIRSFSELFDIYIDFMLSLDWYYNDLYILHYLGSKKYNNNDVNKDDEYQKFLNTINKLKLDKNNKILTVMNNKQEKTNKVYSYYFKYTILYNIYKFNITHFKKLDQNELILLLNEFNDYERMPFDIDFIKYIYDDINNDNNNDTQLITTLIYINNTYIQQQIIKWIESDLTILNRDLLDICILNSQKQTIKIFLSNKYEITQEDILLTSDYDILLLYKDFNFLMTKDTLYKYYRLHDHYNINDLINVSIFCNEENNETLISEIEYTPFENLLRKNINSNIVLLTKELNTKKPILTFEDLIFNVNQDNRHILYNYYLNQNNINQDIKQDIKQDTKMTKVKKTIKIKKNID